MDIDNMNDRIIMDTKYYKPIANESNDVICFEPLYKASLDDHIHMVAYLTSAGIPDCGLYFKIMEFEDRDGEFADGDVYNICRISMERPEYITGYDETFKLSEVQKAKLISNLNSKYLGFDMNLWEYLFYILQNEVHDCFYPDDPYKDIIIPKILSMPDYSLL